MKEKILDCAADIAVSPNRRSGKSEKAPVSTTRVALAQRIQATVTVAAETLPDAGVANIATIATRRARLMEDMRDAVIKGDVLKVFVLAHKVCGVVPSGVVQ